MMDTEFVNEIARNLRRGGYSDRSAFIRDAVYEKLRRLGVNVAYVKALAPPRAHVIQAHSGVGHNYSLNEDPPKYGSNRKKKSK